MSSEKYIPPYKVSGKAMNLIAEIAAAIERYRIILEGPDGVRLRKINHIRTIRGTTAIEGNTLTEEQITAILAGKRVSGPQREIDEVKGAHAAYEAIESFNLKTAVDFTAESQRCRVMQRKSEVLRENGKYKNFSDRVNLHQLGVACIVLQK